MIQTDKQTSSRRDTITHLRMLSTTPRISQYIPPFPSACQINGYGFRLGLALALAASAFAAKFHRQPLRVSSSPTPVLQLQALALRRPWVARVKQEIQGNMFAIGNNQRPGLTVLRIRDFADAFHLAVTPPTFLHILIFIIGALSSVLMSLIWTRVHDCIFTHLFVSVLSSLLLYRASF
jgi:hypothetical protein